MDDLTRERWPDFHTSVEEPCGTVVDNFVRERFGPPFGRERWAKPEPMPHSAAGPASSDAAGPRKARAA